MEATFDVPAGSRILLQGRVQVSPGAWIELATPHELIVERVSRRGRTIRYRLCEVVEEEGKKP